MSNFGNTNFTVIKFNEMWGINQDQIVFDTAECDYKILLTEKHENCWFSTENEFKTCQLKRKKEDTEIRVYNSFLVFNLDKVYAETT